MSSLCQFRLTLCSDDCECIFCEICEHWCHLKCTGITRKQFSQLASSDEPYFCKTYISLYLPFSNSSKSDVIKLFSSHKPKHKKVVYPCIYCKKECDDFPKLKKFRSIQYENCTSWAY